ncbi:helix-turn-helix domain-containing protein [Streptomyces sp. MBT62]|uniref:winged helix-turn-helix transcriptional regulator n=1 Tax=Streptomyces sp. MBT62 TaxID=2800410 RepID=UPI00190AD92B|nr:helix-turn-helix domain-containing protein [Streptomyces sp. MBT62]MBK3567979.1 helix-turn-helix transcriptional regulator [Streptomyces sp. MBT62]
MTTEIVSLVTPGADACGRLPVEHGEFVRQILDRVGDKWSLLVIANLHDGPRRYTDLQQAVTGISQRMLTLTLRQLGEDGLIARTAYAEVPPRVEYALTPLGESFLQVATSLVQWASTHHGEIREHRALALARGGHGETS